MLSLNIVNVCSASVVALNYQLGISSFVNIIVYEEAQCTSLSRVVVGGNMQTVKVKMKCAISGRESVCGVFWVWLCDSFKNENR